jgi:hypothetical protein
VRPAHVMVQIAARQVADGNLSTRAAARRPRQPTQFATLDETVFA